ncbi:retrovirus-related pol polyprotein from transposon TNT 1-94 [Tanacetum coccineum]
MLIYAKAPLFLWAEVVATACYIQNRSIVRLLHGKTPYEFLHDNPPDLSFLHVFGALCYPTNDSENLGKLQPKADIEHAEYDESNTYVLERFNTIAGNPVKEILLKLNLPDHRIRKDGGEST